MSAVAEEARPQTNLPELPALALAEQLSVAALHDFYSLRRFWRRDSEGGNALQEGWYALEASLASEGRRERRRLFDSAYDNFSVAARSSLTPDNHPWFQAAMLMAYRSAFEHRVERKPLDQALRDQTCREVGSVVAALYSQRETLGTSIYRGMGAELITHCMLLRTPSTRFPFFASPREESNRNRQGNHDLYLLEADRYESKDLIQVRNKHGSGHGSKHPEVRRLHVRSVLKLLFEGLSDKLHTDVIDYEAVAQDFGTEALDWVMGRLSIESSGGILSPVEKGVLDLGGLLFTHAARAVPTAETDTAV